MDYNKVNVFNMTLPAEGPVTVPVNRNMAAALEYEIDLTQLIEAKWVSYFSGVYIDNSNNAQDITILVNSTYQSITFPANRQGWVPLLIPNPPIITLSQTAAGGNVKLQIVNFPVWPYILGEETGGSAGNPTFVETIGPTITDYSIAMTGGSIEILAAGEATRYLLIQNPVANGNVVINPAGGDASLSGVTILPGGSLEIAAGVNNAVTAMGTNLEIINVYGGV